MWSTFCNSFYNNVTSDAGSIIVTIVIMILLYIAFTALCIGISVIPLLIKWLRLDRTDTVAIAMWAIYLGFCTPTPHETAPRHFCDT